jgi:hypothetical protein
VIRDALPRGPGDPRASEGADAKATREAREAVSGNKLQVPRGGGGHVGVGFQDLTHVDKLPAATK